MYSEDEFLDVIDNLIPSDVQMLLKDEEESCENLLDLVNVQEKARVLTIKHKISSTHKWSKAKCLDSGGHSSELYWCDVCNIRCSVFDFIKCLSIIGKVKDNLPTYTVHNQYLMLTCNEVLNLVHPGKDMRCFDCGMPEKGKSNECTLSEY